MLNFSNENARKDTALLKQQYTICIGILQKNYESNKNTFNFDPNKQFVISIKIHKNPVKSSFPLLPSPWKYENPYCIQLSMKDTQSEEEEQLLDLDKDCITIRNSNSESVKSQKSPSIQPIEGISFNEFLSLRTNYYGVELEKKISIKEKQLVKKNEGEMTIYYLFTKHKKHHLEIFSLLHYYLYYSTETLSNYITQYCYDIMHKMTHLPCDHLLKFLESLCLINISNKTNHTIYHPLKKKLEAMNEILIEKRFSYLKSNMTNILKNASNGNEFHLFYTVDSRYLNFHFEKEFNRGNSALKKAFNNPSYDFLFKNFVKNDKSKSFDSKQILQDFFSELNDIYSKTIDSKSYDALEAFVLESLFKHIEMYITSHGFLNIDIIMNEMVGSWQKNNNVQQLNILEQNNEQKQGLCGMILRKVVNSLNNLFQFNDGMFHMHLSINNFSYNFNEKNYVHIFPTIIDSSLKNRIRIFDIPFNSNWVMMLSRCIFTYFQTNFQFLYDSNSNINIDDINKMFNDSTNQIIDELLSQYENVLPNYYKFCYQLAKMTLDKYNCIDNLCHHFTHSCVQNLIQNNCIFFSPFNLVFDIDNICSYNGLKPRLNSVLEPYLILTDNLIKDFIVTEKNMEDYFVNIGMDYKNFMREIEKCTKDRYDLNIIGVNNDIDGLDYGKEVFILSESIGKLIDKPINNSKEYNFFLLYNLSYFYSRKIEEELFERFNDLNTNPSSEINNSSMAYNMKKLKILELFKENNKIARNLELLCYLFFDYTKKASCKIAKEITKDKKLNYIKIGYYLVSLGNFPKIINLNK